MQTRTRALAALIAVLALLLGSLTSAYASPLALDDSEGPEPPRELQAQSDHGTDGNGDGGGDHGPPNDPPCDQGFGAVEEHNPNCDDGDGNGDNGNGDNGNGGNGNVGGDQGPPNDPPCDQGFGAVEEHNPNCDDGDGNGENGENGNGENGNGENGENGNGENGNGEEDPCTADAGDPGILTANTLGQTLWDEGLQLSPLTEDPDANGLATGPVHDTGDDTEIEPVTDEASCAGDLAGDEDELPADV